jgi:type I restriction enzyme M protein
MPVSVAELNDRLWTAADQLRANSNLKSSEYAVPVLGLIFLRYADQRFQHVHGELTKKAQDAGSRRGVGKADYHARGVLYLPEQAWFSYLLNLPEGADLGKAVNEAMKTVEAENEELKGVLPVTYQRLENDTLAALLKTFSGIPMDVEGDVFGRIYEYFLGKFAMAEGQRGGEFFTPTSLVRLMVEVIEPFHGRILDPACGSGGMFVQSARFVENHQQSPQQEISVYGQEKVAETVRLCRMNLAVHGLFGEVKQANSYYENVHDSVGRFDFVLANPPFNVNGVDKEKVRNDRRYPLGVPRTDNANYLWIQEFYSALNDRGRAGFVMANSASDARASEAEIRRRLIESGAVDVMIAIGSNFFLNVTLPCTLWFLDRGKRGTPREDSVLFLDARQVYRQVDRAHREFAPEQIEFLANIVRLYRGEAPEGGAGSPRLMAEHFPDGSYRNVPGLCSVRPRADIEAQGWSLNPGRYVGVRGRLEEQFNFYERLEELNEELEVLNAEARELEERIASNVAAVLEGSAQ